MKNTRKQKHIYTMPGADLALVLLCTAAVGFAGGTLVGAQNADTLAPKSSSASQQAPDWTLEPCSLWAGDSAPVLPPYTVTDACVTGDGTISAVTSDNTVVSIQLPTLPAPIQISIDQKGN